MNFIKYHFNVDHHVQVKNKSNTIVPLLALFVIPDAKFNKTRIKIK